MAESFIRSDPDAESDDYLPGVVHAIHLQNSETTDNLISWPPCSETGPPAPCLVLNNCYKNGYRLEQFATSIAEESEEDMAWTIGDTGFRHGPLHLRARYHRIEPERVRLRPLFPIRTDTDLPGTFDTRAIHPGGRAILDKIEKSYSLEPWTAWQKLRGRYFPSTET
ncbi:MAG: hypothetical protein U5K69_04185 [Balneolaceae bacterium]|nr:hypothetical protein [Balneolaceae bacterium]